MKKNFFDFIRNVLYNTNISTKEALGKYSSLPLAERVRLGVTKAQNRIDSILVTGLSVISNWQVTKIPDEEGAGGRVDMGQVDWQRMYLMS